MFTFFYEITVQCIKNLPSLSVEFQDCENKTNPENNDILSNIINQSVQPLGNCLLHSSAVIFLSGCVKCVKSHEVDVLHD